MPDEIETPQIVQKHEASEQAEAHAEEIRAALDALEASEPAKEGEAGEQAAAAAAAHAVETRTAPLEAPAPSGETELTPDETQAMLDSLEAPEPSTERHVSHASNHTCTPLTAHSIPSPAAARAMLSTLERTVGEIDAQAGEAEGLANGSTAAEWADADAPAPASTEARSEAQQADRYRRVSPFSGWKRKGVSRPLSKQAEAGHDESDPPVDLGKANVTMSGAQSGGTKGGGGVKLR
ncbi:hypothetical protein HWV62_9497 [Athelia sp. TMB]|nr:hypothetical protein HWV62_9497 [Athelia sp. TMB]